MKLLILCLVYSLTCAAYKAPLNHKKWELIKYDKIPSNIVSGQTSLDIEVRRSSSPLVLSLDSPLRIKGLNISAKLEGKINYTSGPGSSDNDDFPLRIGLISKGDNSLNFFQKNWRQTGY